ncbi:unnamed protein product, partial [Rotaria sordida]
NPFEGDDQTSEETDIDEKESKEGDEKGYGDQEAGHEDREEDDEGGQNDQEADHVLISSTYLECLCRELQHPHSHLHPKINGWVLLLITKEYLLHDMNVDLRPSIIILNEIFKLRVLGQTCS